MKKVIIFWLNPKNGMIYHRLYTSATFYEVGQTNQYDHVVLAIGVIREKQFHAFNRGIDIQAVKKKEKVKDKIIDNIINKLIKLKDKNTYIN